MAKQRAKSKNLAIARELDAKRRRYGWLSLVLLLVALIVFFGFNILVSAEIIDLQNMAIDAVVYVTFVILAGAVGVCTYQWTKARRELAGHLQRSGISKDDL